MISCAHRLTAPRPAGRPSAVVAVQSVPVVTRCCAPARTVATSKAAADAPVQIFGIEACAPTTAGARSADAKRAGPPGNRPRTAGPHMHSSDCSSAGSTTLFERCRSSPGFSCRRGREWCPWRHRTRSAPCVPSRRPSPARSPSRCPYSLARPARPRSRRLDARRAGRPRAPPR